MILLAIIFLLFLVINLLGWLSDLGQLLEDVIRWVIKKLTELFLTDKMKEK